MSDVYKGDRVRMTGAISGGPEVGTEGTVVWVNYGILGTQVGVRWDNGDTGLLLTNDPYTVTEDTQDTDW
jgi:hypothetical protein